MGLVARRGRSTLKPSARRVRSRSRAISRLRACERLSDAVARTTGPSFSSSRARCRGPRDGDPATSKRTSTRVSDVLACWPPGPARTARLPLELVERDHAARASPAASRPRTDGTDRLTAGYAYSTSNRVLTERARRARGATTMHVRATTVPRRAGIRALVIGVVIALGTTLLVGSAAAAPRKAPAAAAPKEGGSITYGLESETGGGWCPTSEQLAASGIMVEAAIYDTLVAPNDKNVMVPNLAKSVDHNADYTVWTIKLRDGIKFHDGTPLTADAVKQNIEAWRVGTLYSSIYKPITDVTVVDPLTVNITVAVPWVAFDELPLPRRPPGHRGARPARRPRHVQEQPHRHGPVQARPLDDQPGARRQQEPRLLAEGRQGQPAPLPRQDHVQADRRGEPARGIAPGRPARRDAHVRRPAGRRTRISWRASST